ncbi:MAG: DUF1800 domain-containing protein [Pyrinomonas sp.]
MRPSAADAVKKTVPPSGKVCYISRHCPGKDDPPHRKRRFQTSPSFHRLTARGDETSGDGKDPKTMARSKLAKFVISLAVWHLVLLAFRGEVCAATGPILLTEVNSTRAIALDVVTWRRDPFPLVQPIRFGTDERTRIMLFAMGLELLPDEDARAVAADAQDGTGRIYALKVEDVRPVPKFEWMKAITIRLPDEMGEVGDVLVRIYIHGEASNRVRVAIGRVGGGPPDDPGARPNPAPPSPPAPTPTPTPPTYAGPASRADAIRLLEQATWGPTPALIERVQRIGIRAFLEEQFNAPISTYPDLPAVPPTPPQDASPDYIRDNYTLFPLQVRFFQNALNGQDQLRQRVSFALSQIFVVSGVEISQSHAMSPYLQMLQRNAFGNFRQLLRDVTLSPAMGRYLDMVNNDKPDPRRGISPNENYARELLQLFTIGVHRLNPDGTLQLDANGRPIPTYDQETIEELARVFTGWTYAPLPGAPMQKHNPRNFLAPMVPYDSNHDKDAKTLFGNIVLPAGQSAEKDLDDALDIIFNHPNVGPFIAQRLIQHLVTSNPSPAYVRRVAAVFDNNGAGVRGDLRAVVAAILLDPEARGDVKNAPDYGHLREPVRLILNVLRAFNATSDGTGLAEQSAQMGQRLFYAPSVFNYYPPDYQVPGTKLLGPEFGIQTTATTFARINFVNSIVYGRIAPPSNAPPGSTGAQIDLAPWQALADDPQRLINALDDLLLHGTMSPQMRAVITQAVTSIPASQPLQRAQAAVYLVLSSSQYQVQK